MKTNPIKPNTVLPKGGELLRPTRTASIAGWVEMRFDAKVKCAGLTWLRVKGGMGGDDSGEDWVAEIPSSCLSIHAYSWRAPRWGFDHWTSFEEAATESIKGHIAHARQSAKELREKADLAEKTADMLTAAAKGQP